MYLKPECKVVNQGTWSNVMRRFAFAAVTQWKTACQVGGSLLDFVPRRNMEMVSGLIRLQIAFCRQVHASTVLSCQFFTKHVKFHNLLGDFEHIKCDSILMTLVCFQNWKEAFLVISMLQGRRWSRIVKTRLPKTQCVFLHHDLKKLLYVWRKERRVAWRLCGKRSTEIEREILRESFLRSLN